MSLIRYGQALIKIQITDRRVRQAQGSARFSGLFVAVQ